MNGYMVAGVVIVVGVALIVIVGYLVHMAREGEWVAVGLLSALLVALIGVALIGYGAEVQSG